MLLNERDPRIIVINCPGPDPRDPAATICLGDPNGGLGYAAIDQVTYGDIAGDGGNYAVIPLDSGGSIGANGSLIYRVTASPQPELVLSDGPGGAVFVDGGQVVSLSPDPQTNCSVLACFEGMLRTSYKVVAGTLEQTGACSYLPDPGDLRKSLGDSTPYPPAD